MLLSTGWKTRHFLAWDETSPGSPSAKLPVSGSGLDAWAMVWTPYVGSHSQMRTLAGKGLSGDWEPSFSGAWILTLGLSGEGIQAGRAGEGSWAGASPTQRRRIVSTSSHGSPRLGHRFSRSLLVRGLAEPSCRWEALHIESSAWSGDAERSADFQVMGMRPGAQGILGFYSLIHSMMEGLREVEGAGQGAQRARSLRALPHPTVGAV
jgi:hypothetical protein